MDLTTNPHYVKAQEHLAAAHAEAAEGVPNSGAAQFHLAAAAAETGLGKVWEQRLRNELARRVAKHRGIAGVEELEPFFEADDA